VVAFADVTEEEDGSRDTGIAWVVSRERFRSGDGKSYCIPRAILRCPATTTGVSEVAECLENIWRWNFAFVAGRGAVTAPS
jgi:hypothetical protein